MSSLPDFNLTETVSEKAWYYERIDEWFIIAFMLKICTFNNDRNEQNHSKGELFKASDAHSAQKTMYA